MKKRITIIYGLSLVALVLTIPKDVEIEISLIAVKTQ